MDTRTNQIVNLTPTEAELAKAQHDAWLAGILPEKPRYLPIEGDRIPFSKLTRKQRKRLNIKSYKDFCR